MINSAAVLFLLLCVIDFFLLLLVAELLAELHALHHYPAPGRLIFANGKHLHVIEHGASTAPSVILESGLAATSLSWIFTPPLLARFSHVVAYDRAGLGHSAPSSRPANLPDVLADLRALIHAVPLSAPLILVGHSFGGLIVQAFAHLHPDLVAGLVLVDPVSLETYAHLDTDHHGRLKLAWSLSKRGALLARFGIVRLALWFVARGSRRLPAFVARVSAGKRSSVMDHLVGEVAKLPPETHGPIRAHWSKPASFRLMAEYIRLLPSAAATAQTMPVPGHIPMVILSASTAAAAELAERDALALQHPLGRHSQIPNTTHWLQLDRPDVIADAVRQLIVEDYPRPVN